MRWRLEPFDALTPADLYGLMALRQRVFVVEQRCAYLDADGYDPKARHIWAEDNGVIVAAARIFAPGVKYVESSVGRVVTAIEVRRTGLGRVLMHKALAVVDGEQPPWATRISAQSYLERFYGSLGFERVSEPYLEDDIPHIEMLRAART